MCKQLRGTIANLNLYYKRFCTSFVSQFPDFAESDLYCIPENLYIKILNNSCPGVAKNFGAVEIQRAVRHYQRLGAYRSGYHERLFPEDVGPYISVTETSAREERVHTDFYIISGVLLVHGERFFQRFRLSDALVKMIYYTMFGISPKEMKAAISCLEEVCDCTDKELDGEKIQTKLGILLDVFFKHANEIMLADSLWQKKMKQDPQVLKQRVEDVVRVYYRSQGKLLLQNFRIQERDN